MNNRSGALCRYTHVYDFSSDDVRAWYIDDRGAMASITCEYVDGNAILALEHLSTYAIRI